MIFYIDPDSGAITLGKILDRETAGWHNITVKAVEAGIIIIIIIAIHLNSNCIVHHFIIVLDAPLWCPVIVTHQNKVNNSKEQNMSEVDVFPDDCYHQISHRWRASERTRTPLKMEEEFTFFFITSSPFCYCKETADCNNSEELGNYYYMIRS